MDVHVFGSDSRNSVAISGGTWVADTMGDEGKTYLLSVTRNGDHLGWKVGKLSAVLDMLSERAYADFIGEEADTVDVFVLTTAGPVPCRITSTVCPGIGFTDHEVSWREPGVRGKAGHRSERGFTKTFDA
jgi:hypothetical protein